MSSKSNYPKAEQRQIARENRKRVMAYEKELHRKNYTRSEFIARMKNDENVLEVDNLHTYFFHESETYRAVEGASFDVPKGTILGIIGEKGSGKSIISHSIMQLLDRPAGVIVEGEIRLKLQDDQVVDITSMPLLEMEEIRGSAVAMVTDEPSSDLHPAFLIGDQLDDVISLNHPDLSAEQVKERSLQALKLVKIVNADDVYEMYPSQLSAGMRQRVSLAIALACKPSLIILDEPMRSLDVTIQAQMVDLLRELHKEIATSIIYISNDLGDIAILCDYVIVMQKGRVVERGTTAEIFHTPAHPYTQALMDPLTHTEPNVELLYASFGDAVREPSEMEKLSETHYVLCES